jgi:pimeloyl-ACP methyl ester carboxylesterase
MSANVDRVGPASAGEKFIQANGITICHETFGNPADPALLLVNGHSCQMIDWDDEWCVQLAQRGYHVIRYDDRDMGLSTKFDEAGVPPLAGSPLSSALPWQAPYTLTDLADDGIALLGALCISAAHIVGISMGGAVAQLMAIRHPAQVRTMTSIMSFSRLSLADLPRRVPPLPPDVQLRTDNHEAYIEAFVRGGQIIAGRYPRSTEYLRAHAERQWARGVSPAGYARQRAAMAATPSWKDKLATIQAPTLVIHGDLDAVVPVEAGFDTAASIPGAKMLVIEGWGHGHPAPELWPRLLDAISEHAR